MLISALLLNFSSRLQRGGFLETWIVNDLFEPHVIRHNGNNDSWHGTDLQKPDSYIPGGCAKLDLQLQSRRLQFMPSFPYSRTQAT